jgi:hypothetical protein
MRSITLTARRVALRRRPASAVRAASSAPAAPAPRTSEALVSALGANLGSMQDAQDLVITYGGPSAAVPGVVRPLAVVKVGGEVITKDIDNLVASLRFLAGFGLQVSCATATGRLLAEQIMCALTDFRTAPHRAGFKRRTDETRLGTRVAAEPLRSPVRSHALFVPARCSPS